MTNRTHKDCANFQNGVCTLYHTSVNPDGTDICPNFRPKAAETFSTQPSRYKVSKIDREYEKKMLLLQKEMVKEQITYLDKKIQKLKEQE